MTGRLLNHVKEHAPAVALLAAAVALVYLPALGHQFLTTWDDDKYVVFNEAVRGFSPGNLRLAFTSPYAGNYAPVQIVSYMLDYTLWGMNPRGFVATNILLHLGNALLYYRLLLLLFREKTPSLIASLLSVLHPVQVETVVWVSQRKNLLAMTFFLVAFLCYARGQGGNRRRWLLSSLLAFSAAVLTKAVAVILPPALVLYDHCRSPGDGKVRWLEKVPFFVAAAVAGFVALKTQAPAAGGGMTGYHGGSPLATFLTMAPVVLDYLKLCIWPAGLSASYAPVIRTSLDATAAASVVALLGLAAGGGWLYRKERRLFFFFALFFLALLPVAQIVPLVTLMNDRYLYFPLLGGCALGAALLHRLLPVGRLRWVPVLLILIPLGAAAQQRVGAWQDDLTLWRDAVGRTPGSAEAWSHLGAALQAREDFEGAIRASRRALELDPLHSPALNNIALCYTRLGDAATARRYLLLVTEKFPQLGTGFLNLGHNYQRAGNYAEAERAYLRLLALEPGSPEPRLELARLYVNMNRPDLARQNYREAEAAGADRSEVEKGLATIDLLYGRAETR